MNTQLLGLTASKISHIIRTRLGDTKSASARKLHWISSIQCFVTKHVKWQTKHMQNNTVFWNRRILAELQWKMSGSKFLYNIYGPLSFPSVLGHRCEWTSLSLAHRWCLSANHYTPQSPYLFRLGHLWNTPMWIRVQYQNQVHKTSERENWNWMVRNSLYDSSHWERLTSDHWKPKCNQFSFFPRSSRTKSLENILEWILKTGHKQTLKMVF